MDATDVGPACDHTAGTRSYEGNWGRRERRFCACSDLPTWRDKFNAIADVLEPRQDVLLPVVQLS